MEIVFFVGAIFVGFSLGFAANALISALLNASDEKKRMRREVILPMDLLPSSSLILRFRSGGKRPEWNGPQFI